MLLPRDLADEGRRWAAASSQWTIDEDNRELTSDDLIASLLQQASKQGQAFVETSSAYLRRGVYSEALYSHTPTG
jgi:hypothetical protein